MGNRQIRISMGVILTELRCYIERNEKSSGYISSIGLNRKLTEIYKRIKNNFPIKEDSQKGNKTQ
ncbi:unnamed protein product [marine sediment metagenome]|uniref:Uncharacterized protein n=1 Tax=marine sediment metagenome TaxID=412755 RepID=X0ZMQ8_9ZZZZ